MSETVIDVRELSVSIDGKNIVETISFSLEKGKILALVGESGCGKSMTALSLMRLLPRQAVIEADSLQLLGREISGFSEKEMQKIRGNEISIIFQEPASDLDPLMTVGKQIMEAIRSHSSCSEKEAREKAVSILKKVGIPDPEERMNQYPFELSGGMCQRVMIATALVCKPAVLLADEPTTALDVTIQAQILHLIKELARETGTAVIIITHDMGVVAEVADDVAVMYAGKIVESGSITSLFSQPEHPYTKALLASIPGLKGKRKEKLNTIPGIVPDPSAWPVGCRFNTRCEFAEGECFREAPPLTGVGEGNHRVACYHSGKSEG